MKSLDIFALFLPEIKELLAAKDFTSLKDILKKIPSMDLAVGMRYLAPHEKVLIFKLLSIRRAIEVFENLRLEDRSYLINNLESAEITHILNEMAPDVRADLFQALPEKVVKKFFSMMKKEEVEDVRELIKHAEGTAGSIMTTEFVELKKDMTARRAIVAVQESQRAGVTKEIYTGYVTDEEHHVIGGVGLQELLMAPPDMQIKEIMTSVDFIKINVLLPLQDIAKQFKKYNLLDAPVVDEYNKLVGIITFDDISALIERATTKEFYEIGKMAHKEGEAISYANASSFTLVKRRAGWLIFLLIFDFLTGTVLKNFEHALGTVVALSFFIPMLLDTGGNAGAQTSITIIRGLATGDVTFKNAWKVVRLEVIAAFMMGAAVGLVAFTRAILLQQEVMLALVVGFTMTSIVLLAIMTGIFLPFASKKIGLDPAVLAGPITTSIVDVLGLIIYFKVAQFLIPALR